MLVRIGKLSHIQDRLNKTGCFSSRCLKKEFHKLCDLCLKKSDTATSSKEWCLHCNEALCMYCLTHHRCSASSLKHKTITIEDFKRIKANLIIEKKLNKDEIKNIILDAIEKTKNLNTPKNPKYELPFGPLSAPIVIFYVFLKNEKRHSFTLFPENNNFICIAEYYENDKAPRLKFAGTNEKLWKRYKKEKADNIQIAWNPKC